MDQRSMVVTLIVMTIGAGVSIGVIAEVALGCRWRQRRWPAVFALDPVACQEHPERDLSKSAAVQLARHRSVRRVINAWGPGVQMSVPFEVVVRCPGPRRHLAVCRGRAAVAWQGRPNG